MQLKPIMLSIINQMQKLKYYGFLPRAGQILDICKGQWGIKKKRQTSEYKGHWEESTSSGQA